MISTINYVDVVTGTSYTGSFPVKIILPVHHKGKDISYSTNETVKKGEPKWNMWLERYMWYRGYMLVE